MSSVEKSVIEIREKHLTSVINFCTSNFNTIKSYTPGTQAILTFSGDITGLECTKLDVTDIDSSGGTGLTTFQGTLTNTKYWTTVPQSSGLAS